MTSETATINSESFTFPPPSAIILTNLVNHLISDDQFYIETLKLARKFGYSAIYERKVIVNPIDSKQTSEDSLFENSDVLKGRLAWIPDLDDELIFAEQEKHNLISSSSKLPNTRVPAWTKRRRAAYFSCGKESRKYQKHSSIHQKKSSNSIKINVDMGKIKCKSHKPRITDKVDGANYVAIATVQSTDKNEESELSINKQTHHMCHVKPADYELFPIFKNYKEGLPSNKIYIKNLSKKVNINDIHNLYQQFVNPCKNSTSNIDIRFFNKGKLRRQAFITFPTTHMASKAVHSTNGMMLKGKPIYVVFARSGSD